MSLPTKPCGHHEGHVCLCSLAATMPSLPEMGELRQEGAIHVYRCGGCGKEGRYRRRIEALAARVRHQNECKQEGEKDD